MPNGNVTFYVGHGTDRISEGYVLAFIYVRESRLWQSAGQPMSKCKIPLFTAGRPVIWLSVNANNQPVPWIWQPVLVNYKPNVLKYRRKQFAQPVNPATIGIGCLSYLPIKVWILFWAHFTELGMIFFPPYNPRVKPMHRTHIVYTIRSYDRALGCLLRRTWQQQIACITRRK